MVRGLTLALLHLLIGYIVLAYLKPPLFEYVQYILYTATLWGVATGWLFKPGTVYESILPTFTISLILLFTWPFVPGALNYVGTFMLVTLITSVAIAALKVGQQLEELGIFKR